MISQTINIEDYKWIHCSVKPAQFSCLSDVSSVHSFGFTFKKWGQTFILPTSACDSRSKGPVFQNKKLFMNFLFSCN